MKKLILSLFTIALLLTSCQKEQVIQQQEEDKLDFKMNHIIDKDGNELTEVDIKSDEYSLIVEESNLPNKEYNFIYFETEDEVYKFVSDNSKYEEIKISIDKAREIRTLAKKTGDINIENPTDENISEEMKELLNTYKVANKASGVGMLWDLPNSSGGTFPVLGVPIPGYGSFRNRAESTNGAGLANMIHDRTWFRGSSRYLLLGTGTTINFSGMNFSNRAESGV